MNHCAIATKNASNPAWSMAHALTCEARYLLDMPLFMRRDALAMQERQGRRRALESEMTRLHRERKS
jgi:hypothetical protein